MGAHLRFIAVEPGFAQSYQNKLKKLSELNAIVPAEFPPAGSKAKLKEGPLKYIKLSFQVSEVPLGDVLASRPYMLFYVKSPGTVYIY